MFAGTFARTEARQLDVLAHALQAGVNVLVEVGNGHRQVEAALKVRSGAGCWALVFSAFVYA